MVGLASLVPPYVNASIHHSKADRALGKAYAVAAYTRRLQLRQRRIAAKVHHNVPITFCYHGYLSVRIRTLRRTSHTVFLLL